MHTTPTGPETGASVPQQPADSGVDEVPGITLTREIGHGGFGTVYLGRETVIGRDVAVKIDRRALLDDSDRRRFTREVTATGQVSAHPNIVTLLSGGITRSNRPYLVMELCPGGSMNDRLYESGAQSAADVVRVGIAIADALAAAHAVGILHRDVKPANILITAYGAPALSDFGLASLPAGYEMATMSQHALTPSFAAPESFERNAATPLADVFSLGATLYSLLAGRPPRWTPSGPPSLVEMLQLSREPLPRLDVPGFPGLMDAIAHATHPDPAQRTPSAAALRDALVAVAASAMPEEDVRRSAPALGTGLGPGGGSRPASGPGGPHGTVALTGASGHRQHEPMAGDGAPVAATPVPGSVAGPSALHDGPRVSGPVPPPVSAHPPARGRRLRPATIALIAASVAVVVAGGAWGAVSAFTGTGPFAPSGSAADTAQRAGGGADAGPAAANAEDPASGVDPASIPEVGSCWSGLTYISGAAPTSREVDCIDDHFWEAFATGTLDAATDVTSADALDNDPVAAQTCTRDALAEYRAEDPPVDVSITVLGPREALADQGDRTFVCLADFGWMTPKG